MANSVDPLGIHPMSTIEQQLGGTLSMPSPFFSKYIHRRFERHFGSRYFVITTTIDLEVAPLIIQKGWTQLCFPHRWGVSPSNVIRIDQKLTATRATVVSIVRIPLLKGANSGADLDLTCKSMIPITPLCNKG